jgi:hypothetical protein
MAIGLCGPRLHNSIIWSWFRGARRANAESRARSSRELALLRSRWGRLLDEDPYHNPNLLFAFDHLEVPSVPREKRSWDALLEAQVTSV